MIRSRQGIVGEVRQLFDWLFDAPITVRRLHQEERRDPDWAPRMERVLRERFSAVARVPELREVTTEIDCRQSTCEIRVEHPIALEGVLEPDEGRSPRGGRILSRVFRAAGGGAFLAPVVGSGSSGIVEAAAPRRWQTQYLAFSAENMDPETYGAWVAGQRRRAPTSP